MTGFRIVLKNVRLKSEPGKVVISKISPLKPGHSRKKQEAIAKREADKWRAKSK